MHASSVSVVRPTGILARRPSPIIDWSRNNACSTRACCWSRDVCVHRHRPMLFPVLIVRSRTLGRGPRGDTLAVWRVPVVGGVGPPCCHVCHDRWPVRTCLACARSAAHRRAVSGPAALTRCRVARGGGVMRCAGRRSWPGGAADGLVPPAPAARDRRPAGRRRRAVPVH